MLLFLVVSPPYGEERYTRRKKNNKKQNSRKVDDNGTKILRVIKMAIEVTDIEEASAPPQEEEPTPDKRQGQGAAQTPARRFARGPSAAETDNTAVERSQTRFEASAGRGRIRRIVRGSDAAALPSHSAPPRVDCLSPASS